MNITLKNWIEAKGLVKLPELQEALKRAGVRGTSLIQELDELGHLCEWELAELLADEARLAFLPVIDADPTLATRMSREVCERVCCVPVGEHDHKLVVAVANPLDIEKLEGVPPDAVLVVAPESEIRASMHQLYGVWLHNTRMYRAIIEESMESATYEEKATRIVHAMLVDAIKVEGDVHIMPCKDGWKACLCLGDSADDLCVLDPSLYLAVADYLKSFLTSDGAESGEFLIRLSDLEYVSFFLDIDRDYTGEQLFLAILDHHIAEARSAERVQMTVELPQDLYQDFQSATQKGSLELGDLVDHGWSLARDVVDTPCVCPYVDRKIESVSVAISLMKSTAEEMAIAAMKQGQTIEWVVLKVLLMSRECVLKNG